MGLITKEEKKAVVDHYNKMIKWVEKQRLSHFPASWDMMSEIGESWNGDDCPLCKKYFSVSAQDIIYKHVNSACKKCPLFGIARLYCNETDSYWKKLSKAATWKEWLIYAKKLRDAVSILREAE